VRIARHSTPLWLVCLAVVLQAQPQTPSPVLSANQLQDVCRRSIQLMESTGVALPDLAYAGAPLVERARQFTDNLRADPANAGANYSFLANLRAFIALSDAVPKPYPLDAAAQKQLHELRDIQASLESHFRALIELKDRQLRNPDRDNLTRYSDDDSRIGTPKPGAPRVVFLGDSITDFWHLNEYFPDRDFVNRGISGQITGQMLGRMESDVIRLQPAAVLVLGGTNDIARGVSLPAIEDNLATIADLAAYYKIKVLFASVLPVSDYHRDTDPSYERTVARPPATIRALNDWLKTFCAKRNLVYVDYYSKVVDDSGRFKTDLADDGLHPNSAGYRLMAPVALDAINKLTAPGPAIQEQKKHKLFGK
jgi:lysophospholipase L1-like esterase